MPERTSYAPGTPLWIDMGSPDIEGSKAFYSGLFGWAAEADPNPEAGAYTMFSQGRKNVAGLGPQMNPDMPPFWMSYVTVADADETCARVKDAGGNLLVEPMDVLDAGRMAVFMDAQGAATSIWQPNKHIGAELVNEPVSFCWAELNTRDLDGSKAFYSEVFGWTFQSVDIGGGMSYTEIENAGDQVARHDGDGRQLPGRSAAALGRLLLRRRYRCDRRGCNQDGRIGHRCADGHPARSDGRAKRSQRRHVQHLEAVRLRSIPGGKQPGPSTNIQGNRRGAERRKPLG